ncbi:DNA-processing protein DprA [Alkalihalobacillus sp. AL-G]|uniref:DNA-processing protein DprA n=1 Tax=Alkalihalobacillus sp. AL-G TaxID=2926399 RepID=UPI00272979F7|nr:DNA-processing protein DprA [Alkalihalobacillus sp. AL-G]WLD95140.1 DNA-processing protein DprA [Alkalihalobacillus sp. AL-G]
MLLNQPKDRLIYLSQSRGIGRKILSKMLAEDITLKSFFNRSSVELQQRFNLSPYVVQEIYDQEKQSKFQKKYHTYAQQDIQIITILDDEYPEVLREIYDPPFVLYIKGNLDVLQSEKRLSVVGTRDPSENGLKSLRKIVEPLVVQKWTIVSGLAYGIDIHAHKLALTSGGKTIAVLGSGFYHIYPAEHASIASIIGENHLLLSEYPPDTKPSKWQFPMRNRIISGLSRGTLIIEAREKSGSLITGDQALQQGREVFAVPGSIMEPRAGGTNRLIQQGAKLTTSVEDILEELMNITAYV